MATAADVTIAARPAAHTSGSQSWTGVIVRCRCSWRTARMTSTCGRVVARTLTRLYPNRMSSGNWIATVMANIAQDTVRTVASVRPLNGMAWARARRRASVVPTVAVARKHAMAQV
jgi:hypothetical protein